MKKIFLKFEHRALSIIKPIKVAYFKYVENSCLHCFNSTECSIRVWQPQFLLRRVGTKTVGQFALLRNNSKHLFKRSNSLSRFKNAVFKHGDHSLFPRLRLYVGRRSFL